MGDLPEICDEDAVIEAYGELIACLETLEGDGARSVDLAHAVLCLAARVLWDVYGLDRGREVLLEASADMQTQCIDTADYGPFEHGRVLKRAEMAERS